jgi:hypothetical protein
MRVLYLTLLLVTAFLNACGQPSLQDYEGPGPERQAEPPRSDDIQTPPPSRESVPSRIELTLPFDLGASKFYQGPHEASGNRLTIEDPKAVVLVIYSHGSLAENIADSCIPDSPTETPLNVLGSLEGMKLGTRTLSVLAFCTPSKLGGFNASLRSGEPKIQKRIGELKTLVKALLGAGFPAQQLVLMGHSAGAWASLSVAAEAKNPYAAVIAFNPAFAGTFADRHEGWWELRNDLGQDMAKASELKALVYVIEEDQFERPEDLAFLRNIPKLNYLQLSAQRNLGCGLFDYHITAFMPCFAGQLKVIQNYVLDQVNAGN